MTNLSIDLFYKLQSLGIVFDTMPSTGGSYIFRNGYFLNLNQNENKIPKPIKECQQVGYIHPLFETFMVRKSLIDNIETWKWDSGVIQIRDTSYWTWEMTYIWLPDKPLSIAQEESLMNWLVFISDKINKVQCMFERTKVWFYDLLNPNNPDGMTPEEIIKDIRKRYHKCVI